MNIIEKITHLPREAQDTLFLLTLIAWIIIPQTPYLPIWCTAFITIILIARAYIAINNKQQPPRKILFILLTIAVGSTFATYKSIVGQEAGVALLLILLTLKTLEMHAKRDALVIFFLGFFALLTSFFNTQSFLTALSAIFSLLGLLTALINAHRPSTSETPPKLSQSFKAATKMTIAGLPVMIVLFVFFPRFEPLWSMPSDKTAGKTGLSSDMRVGQVANLAKDNSIAMRVKFEGEIPPSYQMYFRGPVLRDFDGTNWTAGFSRPMPPAIASQLAQISQEKNPNLEDKISGYTYEATLEPNKQNWLLTLDIAPNAPQIQNGSRGNIYQTSQMQWMTSEPINELTKYKTTSYPNFKYSIPAGGENLQRALNTYMRLPTNLNPRTQELANKWKNEAFLITDDYTRAQKIIIDKALSHLQTGGYQYTLEPGIAGSNTADEFWFDSKLGFCEHIASAFVVAMRAAGIPSRIVTGFQGGQLNEIDGYWTIRNSDAHAWAEVWLGEEGWMRVDPTAAVSPSRTSALETLKVPDGLLAGAVSTISPTLLAKMRVRLEAFDNAWNQWVIQYTQTRQFDILKTLGFDNPDWQKLAAILGGAISILMLITLAWAKIEKTQTNPWIKLLTKAQEKITQATGIEIKENQTPRAIQNQLKQNSDKIQKTLLNAITNWLAEYEKARYGKNQSNIKTIEKSLKQINWSNQ